MNDLIRVIQKDHEHIESLLYELETTTTSPENRRALADHLITELERHLVAEESYLFPAVRSHLPDGEAIAEQAKRLRAAAEKSMTALENVSPAAARFELSLTKLTAAVRKHIHRQNETLLPRLRNALSAQDLHELGKQMVHTKDIAPSRPHPTARDRQGVPLGLGNHLVETVRDALTGNR
ncbi:hemerythrin domain-containing protein [Actinocrispum sp. NPDC049592]|uniref:hemerythrin domain-containing protein n=1 Tax=Actinocrispum sp. NPDC049592 TaxID=3154835 RepID=UPI0034132DAC